MGQAGKTEKIIPIDSAEAARQATIKGWISRNGVFFRDEHSARHDGCTHVYCQDCGALIHKWGLIVCKTCREKREVERFAQMPKRAWDGQALLYSQRLDAYFDSPSAVEEAALVRLGEGATLADALPVICEPNHASELDADHWYDELPEDTELAPDWLAEAIEKFNEAIRGKEPLSWSPGRFALDIEATRERMGT